MKMDLISENSDVNMEEQNEEEKFEGGENEEKVQEDNN
jgi:hypothetical protein